MKHMRIFSLLVSAVSSKKIILTKDNSSEGKGKGETGLTPHDEVYTVLEDLVIPMSR